MSSEKTQFRPVITAPKGTPCGWLAYGETGTKLTCHGDTPAVHILTATLPVAVEGTALCGYHSPYDVTDAEREAVGQPFQTKGEAGAAKLAEREAILADAGKTWGDKTRAPRWGDAAMVGKVWTASGRMVDDVPAEVSGVEILTDLLTLEPVAEVPTFNVVKAHKMSAPMVSVALAVSAMRGQVDAWHMHNVILPESTKATKATVRALIRRGILAEVTGDNDGTPGSLVAYRLTDTGCDIVAALGCPVTFLPADPSEADTYVRRAAVRPGDCSDGCETVSARSLPVGGTVCLGCGSTFTRTGEDTHPGTLAVSEAVVRRNLARITADIEI
jgi:hypothetical protein